MAENQYDLIIVGTGPAGLTAAIYGQRLGMNTIVFGDIPGGNLYMIENLMNFPGFVGGVNPVPRASDLPEHKKHQGNKADIREYHFNGLCLHTRMSQQSLSP